MAAPLGPPGARELRSRIFVQRRASATTPLGGTSGNWVTIIGSRRAMLVPMTARRGNAEQVIAARLQQTSLWDGWVRYDSLTSTILASDRVCDANRLSPVGAPLRVFNIRFVEDMSGARNVWLFMQLEQGVAEG
jgi:hypothetical protein